MLRCRARAHVAHRGWIIQDLRVHQNWEREPQRREWTDRAGLLPGNRLRFVWRRESDTAAAALLDETAVHAVAAADEDKEGFSTHLRSFLAGSSRARHEHERLHHPSVIFQSEGLSRLARGVAVLPTSRDDRRSYPSFAQVSIERVR